MSDRIGDFGGEKADAIGRRSLTARASLASRASASHLAEAWKCLERNTIAPYCNNPEHKLLHKGSGEFADNRK